STVPHLPSEKYRFPRDINLKCHLKRPYFRVVEMAQQVKILVTKIEDLMFSRTHIVEEGDAGLEFPVDKNEKLIDI
ncbi:hypothetical protein STEG23_014295, partial [Scotinomys teguina]